MSNAKAANGSGSIYQTAAQKRTGKWTVSVTLGYNSQGKRERVRKIVSSKTEAQKMLTQLRHGKDTGTLAKNNSYTVRTYTEYWIYNVKIHQVRATTAAGYDDIVRRYAYPIIGSYRLVDLRPSHIEVMMSKLRKQNLSASTVNQVRRILFGMCKHAQRQDLIPHNPVAATETVRRQQSDKQQVCKPWSREEVWKALEMVQSEDSLDCFLHIMLHTGLRPGEALGLRWEDIDLENRMLFVTGTLKQDRRLSPDGSGVVRLTRNEPKTAQSRRSINISDSLVAALERQQMRQQLGNFLGSGMSSNDAYVVTSEKGTPVNSSNIRRMFNCFVSKHGIRRIRLHDLRHTAAYQGLQGDVPLEILSQAFGHSRIDTTKQIYAGSIPRFTERFMEGMSAILPPPPDANVLIAKLVEKPEIFATEQ